MKPILKLLKLFFILLLLNFPLKANDASKFISLIEDCKLSTCQPHTWWIKDEFQDSFLNYSKTEDFHSWKKVESFPIWMNKHYTHRTSLHTYSLFTFFNIPNTFEKHKSLGISFAEIGEVFEIYINGNLIAGEGRIKKDAVDFHRTIRGVTYEIPEKFLLPEKNRLLIKLSGDPRFDHTGFYLSNNYFIGIYDDSKYYFRDMSSLVLAGIYLIFGLYHLFLFYKRTSDRSKLFFGFWSSSIAIYICTRTNIIFELNFDTEIIQRIELIILYPMVASVAFFFEELFFAKLSRLSFIYAYFCIAASFFSLFTSMFISEYLLHAWQIITLIYGFPIIIYAFIKSIKAKLPNAKRLLVGFLFIIFAATFDILDSLIWNTGIGISKYTFFIFIVFIIFILANKLIELQIKTEELNANLEKKVEERTRALAESLQRVQELKVQQDGDYFLTSLLISPLGKSQIDSETIKIDSFLKQKKQFEFRKRTYEIGGDLCIAHRIRLQNESYIIFVNSDAMGKSIQGAGGAIVLGSLFQSIIERTRSSSLLQNQAPEIWLKSTFIELHKIFESFDGSMLVSLVIGLVDESNGFVYYMNAEHPWLVLYRDGKASYMENDLDFRKLGFISSTNSNLFVKTFQMQVGDKIITGSDGRDDILITDNNGRKYMNENQDFFLRHVEKSNGVLKGIFQSIKQSGEIYDDLSLLSLEYLGNASEQLPKANSKQIEDAIQHYHNKDYTGAISILSEVKKEFGLNQEGLKTLVYSYEQLRSHNLAAITTSFYLKKFPGDNEMLFFASREYFLASDILSAAQYAERLKLREPENIENLIQLIEIYITSKNYLRSMKLIEKLAKLQPEHSKIKAFQKELNELLPN